MIRQTMLSLIAGLFMFTNVIPAGAFHEGQSSGGGTVSAQADPYSGGANFGVPVDVAPGRAGIEPNIQLQYSSGLPNGLLGVGWSLELGSIQRSTKKGVPSYTDSDTFVLLQSGGTQELVFDALAGFYRAKQEGAFMKTEFVLNTSWRVTDKKGTRYYFGEDQASREYDPANTARVFKWALNRVEDLSGNSMTITYWRDGNRLYPQYIDYTSNPSNSLSSFARVEFLWSSRSDTMGGYTAGFLMETNYRLSRVNAWIGTNLQYRFDLTYHASNATNRSLLDTITQYGVDGLSALPPLTFQYQEYVNEPAPTYSYVKDGILNSGISRFFGDFNGDGRADKALYYLDQGTIQVALSNGASFQSPSLWLGNFPSGRKLLLGNFNDDGITDICAFNPANGNWDIYLSNGQSQFFSMGGWISGFGTNAGRGVSTGDFNGDGLTDIVYFYDDPQGQLRAAIALNAGNNFVFDPAATPIVSGSNSDGFTGDFNGDGLTDLGIFYNGNGLWEIRLNTGDIKTPLQPMFFYAGGFGGGKRAVIADFNYDGRTDIGYFDNASTKIVYRLSTGSSFGPEQSSALILSTGAASAVISTADVNGDGLLDFIPADALGDMDIDYSGGVFPDLLASSSNGTGGTAAITYAPSTAYQNTLLPFPLQLVKSVSKSNNRGDVYTTQYDYAQGLWDGAQREFRGFATVTVTDAQNNYSKTRFLQDTVFKGRPVSQENFSAAGNLFAKTENTWRVQEIAPGVNFVSPYGKSSFVYDGNASGRRTLEEYFYEETPQLGNLTRVVQYGEVDLATGNDILGDNRAVETVYVNNTSGGNWLIGLPRLTTVKDQSHQIVRQSWFYYDNQANTAAPLKGFLTKKEDWAGGGIGAVNPVTQYSYDTIGNLLTTTDPKGNVTRVTYDTAYKMFPLATENALAHKVVNEYFGVNGVPLLGVDGLSGLWGQVKSTTDPNQQQGKRSYDVFGRLVMTVAPLDSVAYPTQTTAIEYFRDYTKVTTRQRIKSGQPQTIDAISFYDGFDRLIQTKTPSEVAGRYVVGGLAEYDSRGLKIKQYLPYFSTSLLDTIVPIDPLRPHSTVEYDAMGRPVKTINPDGTYASAVYDDWSTAAVNENGHKQASYFDAWGRLIKKEEYTGADGRSPNYPASPYTLYAATLYTYDSEGNLLQTKDAYNNTTTITYDALGRKTAMNDPDMGAWSYAYDINGNLTKQIDAKGQTLTFAYDALNRLTNKTDGVNGTVNVNYTYDTATVTNAKGRLTRAGYAGGNTQFAYDALGRELQSIKTMNLPAGQAGTTNYQVNRGYDALNNLLQIQYPDQKNIYYKYNAAGQIEAISNDAAILPLSFDWREEKTEQLAYLVSREAYLVRDTSDEIRTTRTFLSSVGEWLERNILGVGEAEAALIAPVLNTATAGNAQVSLSWGAVSGATGYKVKYGKISGGGFGTKDFTKDVDCVAAWKFNETSGTVTDSCKTLNGTVSGTLTRGVAGKYDSGIEFLGYPSGNNALVNFGSDVSLDNLRLRTLAAWIRPDTLGEGSKGTIFSKNYQDGWVLRLAVNNNIAFSQAFSGGVVTWTTTTNAVVMGTWQHVAVTYTGSGTTAVPVIYLNGVAQAVSGTTPFGTIDNDAAYNLVFGIVGTTQEFDGRIDEAAIFKRILTSTEIAGIMNNRLDGGLGMTYATQLDAGNVTSYSVTGLTNGTTYYFAVSAKDATGESPNSNERSAVPVAPAESATLFIKNVDYNASGQMTKIEYGNGDVTTYTYNSLNLRLTRLHTVNAQLQPVQDLNYTYDSAGNILSIDDKVNTADQTFKYDELNRLVEAANPNVGSYGSKSYGYDKIGNIVVKDGKTYFYGAAGAASGGPHAVTALSDGTTFSYDANGNMVTKVEAGVTTNYTYDAENRLIKVTKNNSVIGQYEYDGDGGRTTKIATVSGQTTTTTFVGSLFEKSGSRNTKFIFLGGQRVAAVTNSPAIGTTVLYYHADHLGGANVLTDATGFKKELIEYEPFGLESRHEKYGSSEEVAWYYFTGKPKDDETGLYYYGARYYDPSLGRFITPDDIVPYPTNPQAFNRYTYAGNNPVNYLEDGHGFFSKLFKAIGNAFGSFFGGTVGATIGAFVGTIIAPGVGTFIGAYIGASLGSGIGQSIQHGGNWGSNIGNAFISTAQTFAAATAGFVVGGPPGAIAAVVGLNMGMTAAQGGSFEDIAISGIVTSAYAVAGAAYYKAVGSKVIQKGVEIHNSLKAGATQPLGTGNNTKGKSLSINQGEDASNQQALKLRPNYDVEGKIKSFDLAPENKNIIKVIGRRYDTGVAKGWPGHEVLDVPDNVWSQSLNDAWIQEGINNRQTFYTASPETPANVHYTIYGRELIMIKGSDVYIQVEQYYIPK